MPLSVGAQRIFEFGSGFGYSAYWFSRAVGEGGQVICTDGDAKNQALAQAFLAAANRQEKMHFHVGMAQQIIAEIPGEFDLIYNDADKIDYPEIWQMAKKRLRSGGLYIADNVFWGGRVADISIAKDVAEGWTEAILRHNKEITEDAGFDYFFNPIRDGLIVARKK